METTHEYKCNSCHIVFEFGKYVPEICGMCGQKNSFIKKSGSKKTFYPISRPLDSYLDAACRSCSQARFDHREIKPYAGIWTNQSNVTLVYCSECGGNLKELHDKWWRDHPIPVCTHPRMSYRDTGTVGVSTCPDCGGEFHD